MSSGNGPGQQDRRPLGLRAPQAGHGNRSLLLDAAGKEPASWEVSCMAECPGQRFGCQPAKLSPAHLGDSSRMSLRQDRPSWVLLAS